MIGPTNCKYTKFEFVGVRFVYILYIKQTTKIKKINFYSF